MANYLTETGLIKLVTKIKALHASHVNNTSNPHKVTKTQLALENVENKSSEMIRAEITSENVVDALGFTPLENVEVDSELSTESTNPVENKVVTEELNNKVPLSRTVNGKALDADVVLTYEDVDADKAGTAQEVYDELDEKLDLLDIQTTKDNTLYGTKPGGARLLGMKGNTEQKSYNGYQLFDASKMLTKSAGGATVTNNGDGSFTVSGSGESTDIFSISYTYSHDDTVALLKNGKCTLVADSVGNPYVYMMLRNSDTSLFTLSNYNKAIASIEITQDMLNDESVCLRIGLYMDKGTTITPGAIRPMLYQDGDGTWEPFVGGTQSPNPQYKQSLNNTGDCVEMIQGTLADSDGTLVNSNTRICSKLSIPCNSGDTIVISTEGKRDLFSYKFYDDTDKYISFKSSIVDGLKDIDTYTVIVPNGANKFRFVIGDDNGITPSTVGKISLTVNGKYVTQIRESGKNLFDKAKSIDGKAIGLTGSTYNEPDYTISDYIEIESNETYTLSASILHDWYDFYDSEKRWIRKIGDSKSTFITPDNAKFIVWSFPTIHKDIVQLEVGNTESSYEPYTEHIATIYTDEPIRKGDIVKKIDGLWQVERNVYAKSINGLESRWYNSLSVKGRYGLDNSYDVSGKANGMAYCEIAKYVKSYADTLNRCFIDSYGDFWINTNLETLDEWLAYAKANSFNIEYERATPTYEVLDTASQLALNSLKTFNGVTYIEIDSRVQPSECEWEYGTSQVGAYALQALNENDADKIERAAMKAELEELAAAVLALNQE